MLGLSRKTKQVPVSFSERYGHVCHAECRADAIRERARTQALMYGWRSA